ncbi:hypothetical protein NVP1161O_097 [Vibrio phage 1.161.O._10N.261.48.C5]|nr:hypothetical protein NVP1161O_097 [Vibrio phage 1.161.O._10N.261.48.C5]
MPAKISQEERLAKLQGKYPEYNMEYFKTENHKHYFTFECPECKKDSYAISGISSRFVGEYLKTLKLPPCRCNNRYKTKEMLILDVTHFLTKRGIALHKVLEWNTWKTKVEVSCIKHSKVLKGRPTINELLHRKRIPYCYDCGKEEAKNKLQQELDSVLEFTTYTGVVVEGRSVEISCSVCEKDIYSLSGLCDNKFKTNIDSLAKGRKVSCRCSKRPTYTVPMRELQIKAKMKEDTRGYSFVKWVTEDLGVNDTKFEYLCPTHGSKTISINNYVNNGKGCVDCRNANMRWKKYEYRAKELDTLYLMQVVDYEGESFTKIGRTFNPKLRELNYQESSVVYPNTYETVVEGTHEEIYRFEQDVHRKLKEYHYTPKYPFGGSVKECFSIDKSFILPILQELLSTGEYPSLILK